MFTFCLLIKVFLGEKSVLSLFVWIYQHLINVAVCAHLNRGPQDDRACLSAEPVVTWLLYKGHTFRRSSVFGSITASSAQSKRGKRRTGRWPWASTGSIWRWAFNKKILIVKNISLWSSVMATNQGVAWELAPGIHKSARAGHRSLHASQGLRVTSYFVKNLNSRNLQHS